MLSKPHSPFIFFLLYMILLSQNQKTRVFGSISRTTTSHNNGNAGIGSRSNDNRYSFSLTTFSPQGHLQQVQYATKAATLLGNTPILISFSPQNQAIQFVSLSRTTTPLQKDDGTPRFYPLTKGIAMTHSGINADGRVVLAAAQRLAIEHEYTYQEPIPISILLEEVSLLFQKYTRTPGARPFGCTVVIGDCTGTSPMLYIVGPSGSVERLVLEENDGKTTEAQHLLLLGMGTRQKEVADQIQLFLKEKEFWNTDKNWSEEKHMEVLMESMIRFVLNLDRTQNASNIEKNDESKGKKDNNGEREHAIQKSFSRAKPVSFVTGILNKNFNLRRNYILKVIEE